MKTATLRRMLLIAALTIFFSAQGTVIAQKDSVPKPQNKLALGDNEVRQLMLLIDTNNNGKITKKEWMTFMEGEFDRLDKNKTGELDPKELAQSRIQASHFLSAGK
jgi:Ca2+-binding EF-hand superfamily protein